MKNQNDVTKLVEVANKAAEGKKELDSSKITASEPLEKVETEEEKVEKLIAKNAIAVKCSVEQFKVALLVLAKLKNYFSDSVRAYKLGANHAEALKAIIDYLVEKKFTKIEELADTLYCVRKESPKKAVSDEIIKKIATIEISPRKSIKKELKTIF